jgi:hypothetical protein
MGLFEGGWIHGSYFVSSVCPRVKHLNVTDVQGDLNFHTQRRRFLTPPNYAARQFQLHIVQS